MRYISNPIGIDAYSILEVIELEPFGVALRIDEEARQDERIAQYFSGWQFRPDTGMTARMTPKVGDYVVVQPDGYVYLNPKEVFERKYRAGS